MEKIDICYILIGLLGVAVIYLIFPKEKISVVSPNIEETIRDSLIRDSIYIVNDSIVEKIRYINKEYDKEVSNILSNSDSINLLFFSEYIECYNNQRAIEGN